MSVNGTNDQNDQNNSISEDFSIGGSDDQYGTLQVVLELLTDDYAEETSWEFREVGGSVLYSDSYNEGSDDNTTFIEIFDVELDNCYEFEIFDSYGDGICCQYGEGEYSLSTSTGEIIFEGAEFTDSEVTQMSIGGELSIDDALLATISMYPNPATSEITLSIGNTTDKASYSLYNTFGQLLQQGEVTNNKVLSVSNYTTGIYFVVVKNSVTNIESTLRFIKQ